MVIAQFYTLIVRKNDIIVGYIPEIFGIPELLLLEYTRMFV